MLGHRQTPVGGVEEGFPVPLIGGSDQRLKYLQQAILESRPKRVTARPGELVQLRDQPQQQGVTGVHRLCWGSGLRFTWHESRDPWQVPK